MDTKLGKLFGLLAKADEVRRELPLHLRPEIDDISKGLPQYGPRFLRRKGPGTQLFDIREYDPSSDDPRSIHAKHSRKRDKLMVVEKEAEIHHHFYMWRDASASMDWKSEKAPYTPKDAAEIMMLALAKHFTKNQEKTGLIESGALSGTGNAAEWLATQLGRIDSTHDAPQLEKKLVLDSSALLFSDFLGDPQRLSDTLDLLQARRISGWVFMMEDPQIFDFSFKGDTLFEGLEGEQEIKFDKADSPSLRKNYQLALKERITLIEQIATDKGFAFILQRTDEPLHLGLQAMYGMAPNVPASVQKLGL